MLTCGLLLAVFSFAAGEERIVDTSRLPHNLADCLLRGWPRPGEWVTHEVTFEFADEGQTHSPKKKLIMQSELIPARVGRGNLHWLEVTFREDAKSPPIYVAKLVVDASKARADQWNLAQQGCLGWERRGTNEPTLLTEETIHQTTILQVLILRGEGEWVKRPAADIQTTSGVLRCNSFLLQADDKRGSGEFACLLHPSIPFSCARLSGRWQSNGVSYKTDFQFTGHGTGARSDLPNHDLAALAAKLDESAPASRSAD